MIIRRVDLRSLRKACNRRSYVKHRIPDDDKEELRKKYQFMIRDELKHWNHKVAQEFIVSFKVKEPNKEEWDRLGEATAYFLNRLFKEKGNVDLERSKLIYFKHCEKTVDGYYNIHYHLLIFARSTKNRCLLFGKRETMWAMYDTFKKYDPEMAKKFEKYIERGRGVGRGAAPIWQAQKGKEEIRERLDTLEATPEYRELMATIMARAAYDHHHWRRNKFFGDLPLRVQKIFWRVINQRERVRELELQEKRKKKEHLLEFTKRAAKRADEIRKKALSTKGIWKEALERAAESERKQRDRGQELGR